MIHHAQDPIGATPDQTPSDRDVRIYLRQLPKSAVNQLRMQAHQWASVDNANKLPPMPHPVRRAIMVAIAVLAFGVAGVWVVKPFGIVAVICWCTGSLVVFVHAMSYLTNRLVVIYIRHHCHDGKLCHCPQCAYDQRGTELDHCPECGCPVRVCHLVDEAVT